VETFSRGTLDPHWLTGFVDGEGSFTYSRSSKQIGVYFALKLTSSDRPLLEDIREYLGGIGSIYTAAARAAGDRSGATKTAAYFRVTRRDELMHVVDHFDRYPLRSQKRDVYDLWRMMVHAKQRFRKPNRELLESLASRITALCVRKQPWR
jgi:LAGLIDADG endonuclease